MFRLIETDAPREAGKGARAGVAALVLHAAIVTGGVVATGTTARPEPPRPPIIIDHYLQPDTPRDHAPPRLPPGVDGMIVVPDNILPPDLDAAVGGPVFDPRPAPGGATVVAAPGDASGGTVFAARLVDGEPELLAGPPPVFPEHLRRAGVEGRVVVEATVDTTGRVEPGSVVVVTAPHPDLGRAAAVYLERALFRPGTVAGRPVRVRIRQGIEFRLRR